MNRLVYFLAVPAVAIAACSTPRGGTELVKPVYNKQTGKLEQLTADRGGTGKIDTRAYMDGTRLKFIEVDRNGDGTPDRWEYYSPAPAAGPAASGSLTTAMRLERAEEANGSTGKVTRWEFYKNGAIDRVEEDTDFDGRVDKWEQYANGALSRMELDLQGRGTPDRRFTYAGDGSLARVEMDPSGTGTWVPLPSETAPATVSGSKKSPEVRR